MKTLIFRDRLYSYPPAFSPVVSTFNWTRRQLYHPYPKVRRTEWPTIATGIVFIIIGITIIALFVHAVGMPGAY